MKTSTRAQVDSLLQGGAHSDYEISTITGASRSAVQRRRIDLGTDTGGQAGNVRGRDWATAIQLMLTHTDNMVSALTGIPERYVTMRRAKEGIAPWTLAADAPYLEDAELWANVDPALGRLLDSQLARAFEIDEDRVRERRVLLNIEPLDPAITVPIRALLGIVSDQRLARATGVPVSSISSARRRIQVETVRAAPFDPDMDHGDLDVRAQVALHLDNDDRTVAAKLGLSLSWVKERRLRLRRIGLESRSLPKIPKAAGVIYFVDKGRAYGYETGKGYFDAPDDSGRQWNSHQVLLRVGPDWVIKDAVWRLNALGSRAGCSQYLELVREKRWLAHLRKFGADNGGPKELSVHRTGKRNPKKPLPRSVKIESRWQEANKELGIRGLHTRHLVGMGFI